MKHGFVMLHVKIPLLVKKILFVLFMTISTNFLREKYLSV
jgi:hypothetical protein